jgi:hypothetical protein
MFEWCYRKDIAHGVADFWCPLCIETKLPDILAKGASPR